MFHDDSKDFEKSHLIKGSNFSDLSLDKEKQSLIGY